MKTSSPLSLKELLSQLPDYYTLADRELIQRAYRLAEKAHAGQKRASGEPYVYHCLAVAAILAEYLMPTDIIAAGLLHDTLEDTSIKFEDLRSDFGEGVANLVQGVTKLTQLPRVSRGEHQEEALRKSDEDSSQVVDEAAKRNRKRDLAAETLRKTFLAMDSDVRVVLIKLADRLHNMRTLGAFPEAKRRRIAQETLDIFAPLANRLGIWQIKWELEDLGFRYTNPQKYKEIAEQLAERRETRETEIQHISEAISKLLAASGIKAEISGRSKHIYSIYHKMIEKGKSFDLVRDVRGIRLIVPDVAACYAVLGLIHTHWRPIPGEFDDYIAAPKDNFYQSLHTVIIYDDGKPVEVQIRTHEMNENAEIGIAAHWRYKEGGERGKYDERINWLRRVMEWKQDVDDAHEFVDSMKTDVFKDRVYVFTPHGDIIDLPAGSTPIDFAYHVHTTVGDRCRGAKVNNKLVPLDYTLKTGEQVEILTAKQGGPSRDWLNQNLGLVRTQRARSKIKAWFKKQNREQNITQGREMLEHEIQRLGLAEVDEDGLKALAQNYGRTPEELYDALGCGDLTLGRVVNKLLEAKESDDILVVVPASRDAVSTEAVTVLGLKGLLTAMAKCCNPTPGDEIIGYITRGHGATIHRQDCPNILRIKDRERLVKVSWGENVRTYPVPIRIRAYDRQGLMGDITTLLNSESVNIVDVQVGISKNLADLRLVIEVRDIAQLSRMLARIENLPNVLDAQRVRAG
ncbi:MAG: bifunctional (p)ppGpp synthetase/guanosine-3',5'-bis(diphosphate) 3'-pyrophosphohydrolase [Chloroflexi bacterium]|nr:bifunctional (p)ppGpp synthetase/guanosine-3',5'-bis(diphosphate) 3'-pyrophosphohydrolase [Chloroflexota bacterium]